MKTTLFLSLALAALPSAQAQLFRPEAVNGAVLGGIAGAVIGNNSGDLRHNAWKGAAIGAGAGLILGEAVGNANAAAHNTQVEAPRAGHYVYRNPPSVSVGVGYSRGYGYGHHGHRDWHRDRWHGHIGHYGQRGHYGYGHHRGAWGPRYGYVSYAPSYSYYSGYGDGYPYYDTGYYGTRSAATNGLLLGALAGGIIGHNSGDFRHNGWRGAAWGAGAGWLLGSVIDANRRPVYESTPVVVPATPTVQVQAQPAQQAQPQQITIINNYYNSSTPMSGVNGMFGR